ASEALGHDQATVPSEDMEEREEEEGKAPMPDLEIPAEFLAVDAQARQRLEEEQASARLVQQLQAEDLAQADVPLVSEQRAKELDELLLPLTVPPSYCRDAVVAGSVIQTIQDGLRESYECLASAPM
ncbi:hypothetical protein Tco_0333980, partial [Tanacetum coccineum]